VILFYRFPDYFFSMPKNVAVVIQEDPRKTHRPVEALRIALGLSAGSHMTTVVLLGEATRLLGDETDDILDIEILEKYLPAIKQLEIQFIIQDIHNPIEVQDDFSVKRENDETIRSFIQSMDCTLVF
jgi:sulfur relay (sulfurtransferase) DsrF/TusC family protein